MYYYFAAVDIQIINGFLIYSFINELTLVHFKSDTAHSKYATLAQGPHSSTKHNVPNIATRKYITSKKKHNTTKLINNLLLLNIIIIFLY